MFPAGTPMPRLRGLLRDHGKARQLPRPENAFKHDHRARLGIADLVSTVTPSMMTTAEPYTLYVF